MRRAHRASGRAIPWVVLVVVILAGLGAGAFFVLRPADEQMDEREPEEPPVPEFQFELAQVKTVPLDEDPSGPVIDEAAAEVEAVLDELYTLGFIDPALWGNGRFPGLTSLFSGPAARQARRDREDLTLGSAARQVERVEPGKGRLTLDLLVDAKQMPVAAIAETRFRASGVTVTGQQLSIRHGGRFHLRPVDGTWLIVGYEVTGNLETVGSGASP